MRRNILELLCFLVLMTCVCLGAAAVAVQRLDADAAGMFLGVWFAMASALWAASRLWDRFADHRAARPAPLPVARARR